jgi:hypothetical protein
MSPALRFWLIGEKGGGGVARGVQVSRSARRLFPQKISHMGAEKKAAPVRAFIRTEISHYELY